MIIGAAGHIDHGKTALIRRLTGIDTDRLPEEKRRGMTIDLGFAHLDLEGAGRVGIVDVPGHDRFVHNMVAGASGFDLVLLVVAADDGVMPQTREHLDIVSLLGIESCVVALNKIDLVAAARVQAVTEEIRALASTAPCLRAAPIVPVSAHTGEGLDALRRALAEKLKKIPPRDSDGYFRMAIDRAFTMTGFGPVVTGTIASGRVRKDDSLRLLPGGATVRVRGLQTHNQAAESAEAGNRCALNLAGVEKDRLQRGMMVCDPRLERVAHMMDVTLKPAHGLKPPHDHQRVRFHSGTAEVFARLAWIEPPSADAAGVAQLRLENPAPLLYRDRFVLRDETARHTLGGGIVLDPFAARRGVHRPERRELLHRLRTSDTGEALETWLTARGAEGWLVSELAQQLAEPPERLMPRLAQRSGMVREEIGSDTWIASSDAVDGLLRRLQQTLADYLREHPRATAMPVAGSIRAFSGGWLNDWPLPGKRSRLKTACACRDTGSNFPRSRRGWRNASKPSWAFTANRCRSSRRSRAPWGRQFRSSVIFSANWSAPDAWSGWRRRFMSRDGTSIPGAAARRRCWRSTAK